MKYPKMVEALDRILYLTGKQRISYRWMDTGNAANSDTLLNPGNFLVIIQQVTHCYLLHYEHIHLPLRKDVSYINLVSQNE